MPNSKFFILIICFLISRNIYSQEKQNIITVVGDSLVGRMLNGETVREVFGNVVLTQGNVRITCKKAIQYISRNDAELIGNVIATQDTLVITTDQGYYYGNERKAESVSGVTLNDKKVVLTADTGSYFFNDSKAVFKSRVILKDTSSTVTSDQLIYYKDEGKTVAIGNVKIIEGNNIIKADSLVHFRESRITIADRNVKISSLENNTVVYSQHLEDYPEKHYTFINQSPLLIQIDTTYINATKTDSLSSMRDTSGMQIDTLIIRSQKMESFRDTSDFYKAIDSVRILRGMFASVNNFTEYFRKEGKITTEKILPASPQPILWYDNSQLTGDSTVVYIKGNNIDKLDVERNAFILSQNKIFKNRFDQISGNKIIIRFEKGNIVQTDVYGGIHSIYYLYDGDTPNGLTKSSSESAKIYFEDNKVSTVKLYGTPNSEYYPEKQVKGSEPAFTLPGYVIHNNRPEKQNLLKLLPKNGLQ